MFQKGRQKTGGRKKGVGNKVAKTAREMASIYSEEAMKVLAAELKSKEPQARLIAAKALLDRAFGTPKATHEIQGELQHSFVVRVPEVLTSEAAWENDPDVRKVLEGQTIELARQSAAPREPTELVTYREPAAAPLADEFARDRAAAASFGEFVSRSRKG